MTRLLLLLLIAVIGSASEDTIGLGLGPVPAPASSPPSGSAGGDLTGTYPNPTVAGIAGATGPIVTTSTLTAGSTGQFAVSSAGVITGVGTSITGTAAGLTAGAVTTNANLTGPITSTGNATAVAAQTGTGSTFVMQASPTLTTPVIGAATATSVATSSLTVPLYVGGGSTKPGATFVGNVLWGDQDGTTAAVAGQVGEVIAAGNASYTNFTTTATYQALNSASVTPGYWMCTITVTFSDNGATLTATANAIAVVSTVSGSASGALEGNNIGYVAETGILGSTNKNTLCMTFPITVTTTTTYYLNAQETFTAGNPQSVSRLQFVRLR